MVSVVFLDLDGVLNRSSNHVGKNCILPIYQPCLDRFLEFVIQNDFQVVLSSSHRKLHVSPETLRSCLHEVVDHFHDDWRTGNDKRGHRGNEVRDWLLEHPEVEKYIIFDDDSDFYQYQPFIKTDHHFGLTDLDLLNAQNVLSTQMKRDVSPFTGTAYFIGDLIQSRCLAIAHGCNAQGKMNSGVAKAIREAYPEAYEVYMHKDGVGGGLHLGEVTLAESNCNKTHMGSRWIANIITQQFYGYDGRKYVDYNALRAGLTIAADRLMKEQNIFEIGLPKIGGDRGGGDWEIIKEIIESVGVITGVKFTIFLLP